MDAQVLEKVLQSFSRYYNIKKEGVSFPFDAEAEFHAHGEQYFLTKAAKISEINSNEYVYFSLTDRLDSEKINFLSEKAWSSGLGKVIPSFTHRNSDVTLVILSENIEREVLKKIKKIKYYKSYCFGLKGWSNFKLIAAELSSGQLAYNRFGADLKKTLYNII